jgi:AraC-like DNA-binding protein
MPVLSDILTSLRAHGSVYFCDRRDPPWSMEFSDVESASFHLVRRGECWVIAGDVIERLGAGDLLFVEPGRKHVLTSEHPKEPRSNIASGILLLCGYCRFDTHLNHPLIKALPILDIVRGEELLEHAWLKNTLDQLSGEYTSGQPGSQIIVNKLTEILLIELIRINFGRSKQSGFIAALSDKQISKALELLHTTPQKAWTLEGLATEVAMSRAALAKRFKQLVGQTMFEYLTALRMQRAQELLRESDIPLYQVANRVGYESDLAFTKAFKRFLGMTPTSYRKTPN